MKTLITVLLLLITITVNAQTTDHSIITGEIILQSNSYELSTEDSTITMIQLNDMYTKERVFSLITSFVSNYSDINYFKHWYKDEDNDLFISVIIANKQFYYIYYSEKVNRLIIKDINVQLNST